MITPENVLQLIVAAFGVSVVVELARCLWTLGTPSAAKRDKREDL